MASPATAAAERNRPQPGSSTATASTPFARNARQRRVTPSVTPLVIVTSAAAADAPLTRPR